MSATPQVLFVCVHNAGRSQMAAAFLEDGAGESIKVRSAGTEPADEINPLVLEAMREVGIDLSARAPRLLSDDDVRRSDYVITMGCGDACPVYPGKHYEDWDITDPSGRPIDGVKEIRDEIRRRVEDLLGRVLAAKFMKSSR